MAPKRKRTGTATSAAEPPAAIQPSSRDASDEGTSDPILSEVSALKEKQENGTKATKRSTAGNSARGQDNSPEDPDSDSGKRRSKRNVAHSSQDQDEGTGQTSKAGLVTENGAAEDVEMEQPSKAGLVDPVGYHTNPPPQGRTVRVYADGVFDLFHLGYVLRCENGASAIRMLKTMSQPYASTGTS